MLFPKPDVARHVINLLEKFGNLDKHLTTCKERIKHIFLKHVYQLLQTLFDQLDSLGILHTDNQKLFDNRLSFDLNQSVWKVKFQAYRNNDMDWEAPNFGIHIV